MAEAPGAPWPPETLDHALGAELSATTRRALEAAGTIAVDAEYRAREVGRGVVGLRELIGGLVTVGEAERGSPLIAGALVETLEKLVGPERIAINRAPTETRGSPTGLPLSPSGSDALVVARRLAERTVARERIDARHLLVALIAPPEAPLLAAALRRIWQRDWGIDPQVLRAPVLAAMEANPEASEDLGAWRAILGEAVLTAAAFTPDAPQTDDALNRRGDARRLAELACLKDNAPPLAIGLFGDWGSGKSTFMAMMHQEVERIGRDWKAEANTPFVTNVAQIRFNAWSFSDAISGPRSRSRSSAACATRWRASRARRPTGPMRCWPRSRTGRARQGVAPDGEARGGGCAACDRGAGPSDHRARRAARRAGAARRGRRRGGGAGDTQRAGDGDAARAWRDRAARGSDRDGARVRGGEAARGRGRHPGGGEAAGGADAARRGAENTRRSSDCAHCCDRSDRRRAIARCSSGRGNRVCDPHRATCGACGGGAVADPRRGGGGGKGRGRSARGAGTACGRT
jgi:hypothetical protein